MVNCAIGIVLYNRPAYTLELFQNLVNNHNVREFPIYVNVDACDDAAITNRILDIINDHSYGLSIATVRVNQPRLGCGYNHFDLIDNRIKEDDFIIFEDDTIPAAADALNYFYSSLSRLKAEGLLSVCGFNRASSPDLIGPPDRSYDVTIADYFCPWGFATTKHKWAEAYASAYADPSWRRMSWDAALYHNLGPGKRLSLFPLLSRMQNIGAELGTHVPSADWHRDNHFVNFGAWHTTIDCKPLGCWYQR